MARRLGWWAFVTGMSLLVLVHAWRAEANHDEIEHLHAAWLVANGARPHVDFFEHHPPVFWWLLGPLTRSVGSPHTLVFAARLGDLLVLGALLWLTARIVRLLSPEAPLRWPILLLLGSFNFVRSTMEVRPDPLMCMLAIAGLERALAYLDKPRASRAIASGLLFGAATAVLQKALVPTGLIGLTALMLATLHRADRAHAWRLLSDGTLFGIAAALPLGALLAALAARGGLVEFWFWNYSYNRFFHWSLEDADAYSALGPLVWSIGDAPILWIGGAAGFGLALRRVRRARHEGWLVMLALTTGYALFLASNRCLVHHYFLPLLPLLAIFAAPLFAGRRWLALLTLAIYPLSIYRLVTYPDYTAQNRIQEYVLAHSNPGDRIFVTPPHHPIFRRDAVYFWFSGARTYERLCETRDCSPRRDRIDRQQWDRAPPVLVYLDPRYHEYHPPGRSGWITRSEHCRETEVASLFRCQR